MRRPSDRTRRRLSRPGRVSGERLARRFDRAARRLNPYLLATAIGLAVLYLTFFAALKIAPPGSLLGVRAWHHGSAPLSR